VSGERHYASAWVCVEKCPQGLDLPTLLEQVVSQFEGEGPKEREAMARRLFEV